MISFEWLFTWTNLLSKMGAEVKGAYSPWLRSLWRSPIMDAWLELMLLKSNLLFILPIHKTKMNLWVKGNRDKKAYMLLPSPDDYEKKQT